MGPGGFVHEIDISGTRFSTYKWTTFAERLSHISSSSIHPTSDVSSNYLTVNFDFPELVLCVESCALNTMSM